MRKWLAFALAWVLILGGSYLAHRVQTDGGVRVSDVRFQAEGGLPMSGLLYVPAGATAQHPAPAVLASHGYINTREMQSAFAIELARRGYVVLAMDMTGHGYSGGTVGSAGFGGPAALKYLKSLPFVDRSRIGLEGHSMGSGPVMAAALSDPDGYRAIVLEGSTPGLLGAPAPANPRNFALVFGQYDEFSVLMWGVPKGSLVAQSPKLQALFGTPGPVEVGRLYGSIAEGSGRLLLNPPVTHPGEHFTASGVAGALQWFDATLQPGSKLAPTDQIWIWKDVGTLIGFIGMVGLILATFDLLLDVGPFRALAQPAEPQIERRTPDWWLSLALTAVLPAITYIPLMKVGAVFKAGPLYRQAVHNQLLVWALGTAAITLLIGVVWRRREAFTTRWALSIGAAVVTMGVAYLSLVAMDALFKVDYRFWVLGLKPLNAERAAIALPYLPLWTLFFLISLRALAMSVPVKGESLLSATSWSKIAMAMGFVGLVAWQYVTLFTTGLLATPQEPLNVIIAIQFIPLLGVFGVIAAFAYRRTNSYAPAAFICALLVCWYVSSGTANHWAPPA